MDQALYFPNWQDKVVYATAAPQPQVLLENDRVKVVVVGLEPGAQIPDHPGDAGVYHFLAGIGQMCVGDQIFEVQAGGTVITPPGATRGMIARTRLALIAVRIV